MDPRHLKLYNDELHYIREMGKIFSKNHPDVAEHLDLARGNCTDPYVERLLEGFAFLTSRIQLQYEEEFPEFSQHLLDIIYPDFLSPLPSMTIIQLSPGKNLQAEGFIFPKQTRLLSKKITSRKVQCEYRTSQDIQLWPIQLSSASYESASNLPPEIRNHFHSKEAKRVSSAIKLQLEITNANLSFQQLSQFKELPIYIKGSGNTPGRLYESLVKSLFKVVLVSPTTGEINVLPPTSLEQPATNPDISLLPKPPQSFQGYRLLQEYFAFPERFQFLTLNGLDKVLTCHEDRNLDIYFLLNAHDPTLQPTVDHDNFKLFCSPAINLFEKKSDTLHLNKRPEKTFKGNTQDEVSHAQVSYPIIINKSNPADYEVYRLLDVQGIRAYGKKNIQFSPFYSLHHSSLNLKKQQFYTLNRKIDLRKTDNEKYRSNKLYITINDNITDYPNNPDIKELRINALCTNRGLPLRLGNSTSSFSTPDISPPIEPNGVQNIEPFSAPKPTHLRGDHTWKLINLLSFNHLSIVDEKNPDISTQALKDLLLLQLHTQTTDNSKSTITAKQLEITKGIHQVETESCIHPIILQGRMSYARGIRITVTLEENAFKAGNAFLFGSVLNQFFSQYVSINSFTLTHIKTIERGNLMEWPIQMGTQKLL